MNLTMSFPEVLILSTQRSGTHLLESFLKNHPDINGRGEMFLRYERKTTVGDNVKGKLNIAILMYNQVNTFLSLGGDFKKFKIIHLIRRPESVALSRCQMIADKLQYGKSYRAHMLDDDDRSGLIERNKPDLTKFENIKIKTEDDHRTYLEILRKYDHLLIHYEEIVPNNESVTTLDPVMASKIGNYLEIEKRYLMIKTNYIKTGIIE